MEYKKRIYDKKIKEKMETFRGVLITGPKGCGKTTTAKQFAKRAIQFQDEDKREQLLKTANIAPSILLQGVICYLQSRHFEK